jgi:glyoxylase-like metal-dependent hydrolase (beta-lactamase superfamily II)
MFALPAHLAADSAQGPRPGEPVAQFEIGDMRNFIYLIIDWTAREAAIIDPQSDLRGPLAALESHELRLTRVLLTHTHHDHVGGVAELARRYPDIPVHLHREDRHRLAAGGSDLRLVELADNEAVRVGAHEVMALHTPGHSAGELCYFVAGRPPYLFTGDTVFIRDCGRTDFPSGSNEHMFASLQRIRRLPGDSVILPGHHYTRECASTLERELRESPPFQCRSVDELRALP